MIVRDLIAALSEFDGDLPVQVFFNNPKDVSIVLELRDIYSTATLSRAGKLSVILTNVTTVVDEGDGHGNNG